jgi:hypothetical protein
MHREGWTINNLLFSWGKFLQCGDQKKKWILQILFGKNAKNSPYFEKKKGKNCQN